MPETLTLRPSSDNTKTEFVGTGDTTNLYANVDESSKNESDYNQLMAVGAGYVNLLYGFPDVTVTMGAINKVTVNMYLKQYGTENRNKLAVKIGSTVYYGDEFTPDASTTLYTKEWTVKPSDSSAWTKADIDALVAGAGHKGHTVSGKAGTTYIGAYEYMTWVEVEYMPGNKAKIIIF